MSACPPGVLQYLKVAPEGSRCIRGAAACLLGQWQQADDETDLTEQKFVEGTGSNMYRVVIHAAAPLGVVVVQLLCSSLALSLTFNAWRRPSSASSADLLGAAARSLHHEYSFPVSPPTVVSFEVGWYQRVCKDLEPCPCFYLQ